MPAGENPPPGAILDYFLAADASGPVTLEILDARQGDSRLLERRSDPQSGSRRGSGRLRSHLPGEPHRAGLRIAALLAGAADGRVVEAPACIASTGTCATSRSARAAAAAATSVPRRTYPAATAPWAPPGAYVVRLTVGGKSYTQPLTLHLDPRVKTPALALTTLASLTREMYNSAKAARAAADEARALAAQLAADAG